MSNYSYQYRKYYEEMKNKKGNQVHSPVYRSNSFETTYRDNDNKKGEKEKKEFFSSMINIFIYQLAVVTFMLFSVFYFRYFPGQQKNYEQIKAVMSDTTYTINEKVDKVPTPSEIFDKINNYIKLNLIGKKIDF